MNQIILIGRLTRDPERRMTQGASTIASFTLAVDRQNKNHEADFIPITAWNKQADTVLQFLKKGSRILVQGSLRQHTYDGRNGEKQTRYDVWMDRFEFLDTKSEQSAAPAPEMTPAEDDVPLPF